MWIQIEFPFVFGAWFRRCEDDDRKDHARRLAILLDHCRRHNRERIDAIIAREAPLAVKPAVHRRAWLGYKLRLPLSMNPLALLYELMFLSSHNLYRNL